MTEKEEKESIKSVDYPSVSVVPKKKMWDDIKIRLRVVVVVVVGVVAKPL